MVPKQYEIDVESNLSDTSSGGTCAVARNLPMLHVMMYSTVLASGMWTECTGPKMAYVCAFRALLGSLKSHRAAIWEAPPPLKAGS